MTLPPLPELRTAAQAAHIALTCISTHPTLDMSDYLRGRVDAAAAGLEAALAAVPAQPVAWTHVDYLTAAEHARQNDYPFAISAQARGPTPTHDVPLYAAPQAVPVPAWQPIETAPKDRDVLVACSHGLYVARYCEHDIEWWHVDDNKHGPFPLRGSSPTHWQPLPAAPKEQP